MIDHILQNWGSHLSDVAGMPEITGNWGVVAGGNRLLNEQLDYNREQLGAMVAENAAKFNNDQRAVYNAVMESVNSNTPKVFFLHSAGGCGKPLCVTPLLLQCVPKKRLHFVLHHLELPHFFLTMGVQLIPIPYSITRVRG